MKVENYSYPKSSFLSVEKDMSLIVDKICENQRLLKLLYYTTPDCLSKPDLNEDQIAEVLEHNLKLVPKVYVDDKRYVYLFVKFDNFLQGSNPEFRDNSVEFDILCGWDLWQLDGYALRPYRIMAELDMMFNKARLTGLGKTEFVGATDLMLTDEFGGYCLMYSVVHGGEDKYHALNPSEQDDLDINFNQIYNSDD